MIPMVPNPNDADRKLDFFINIAVIQILAVLQTIAGMAGLTGDEFIVFFTRVITRMHSSVAHPIVASTPVNASSDTTASHSILPQSGDRIGFSSKFSSAPCPTDTSISLSSSTAATSHAPVSATPVLDPQTIDIASELTSTLIAPSNDISASEPEGTLTASPCIAAEDTAAVTSSAASSSPVTPTDDRPLCLTSVVPSDTARRRPRPLRREGACIFQNVAGQIIPAPLPHPAAPTIVSHSPFFVPPDLITPAFVPVTSTTSVSSISDTTSHLLIYDIPVHRSSAPSSESSKRSRDESGFDKNEAVEYRSGSASPPKRRRS